MILNIAVIRLTTLCKEARRSLRIISLTFKACDSCGLLSDFLQLLDFLIDVIDKVFECLKGPVLTFVLRKIFAASFVSKTKQTTTDVTHAL